MILTFLLTFMIPAFQDADADDEPWIHIVSQEGKFIVDFPTKPSEVETTTKTANAIGRIKQMTIACDTPNVRYAIIKTELLQATLIKGKEEFLLNGLRDYFAQTFNGKLVSEKKVRYQGSYPGIDYILRVQPDRRGPVGIIRIRQYISGREIYALIAVSAANQELPPDVGKFFGSFTMGTTIVKKSGPRTDFEGKELEGWGTLIDPDGDCDVQVEGKALVMNVPGTLHDLNADIDKYNAPRILREVEGDFQMTVKVVGEFKPGAGSNRRGGLPFNGGGLFVWRDSDNFIRLERGAVMRNGKVGVFSIFEEREGGSSGAQHNGPLAPGTTHLKLERRGGRIYGFTSKDGKRWVPLKPIDTVWGPELKIGLDAINSSDAPFTVRFENFSVKTKKPRASARPKKS
jgi:regulation of enolase protein 1 (concanavalin A-like superfamily)